MDFAGPFVPSGEGKWDMVIVVVDKLTKRCHFVPSKSTDAAPTTAKRFFDSIVRLHGIPAIIVSDRDAKFTSAFWKTLFERLGTRLAMSTAYHPQTDGQSERMVRTLKEMLRSVVGYRQDDWTDHLAAAEFAYNDSVHPSTGLTPFELDLGYHPRVPMSKLLEGVQEVASTSQFLEKLEALQHFAFEKLERARQQQAESENKNRPKPVLFQPGELVLLSTKHTNPPFMKHGGTKKLKPKYTGPYMVTRRIGATSYELDLPANMKIHPVVNLEYLKKYHASPDRFGTRSAPPSRPQLLEGAEPFQIGELRAHRISRGGRLEYLTHWAGYNDFEDSWEPEDHVRTALADYWKRLGLPVPGAPVTVPTEAVNTEHPPLYFHRPLTARNSGHVTWTDDRIRPAPVAPDMPEQAEHETVLPQVEPEATSADPYDLSETIMDLPEPVQDVTTPVEQDTPPTSSEDTPDTPIASDTSVEVPKRSRRRKDYSSVPTKRSTRARKQPQNYGSYA